MSTNQKSANKISSDIDYASITKPFTKTTNGGPAGIKSNMRMILDCLTASNPPEEFINLIVNECDIIFECKMCRSLHRALPNFLAHKRFYCQDLYQDHGKRSIDVACETKVNQTNWASFVRTHYQSAMNKRKREAKQNEEDTSNNTTHPSSNKAEVTQNNCILQTNTTATKLENILTSNKTTNTTLNHVNWLKTNGKMAFLDGTHNIQSNTLPHEMKQDSTKCTVDVLLPKVSRHQSDVNQIVTRNKRKSSVPQNISSIKTSITFESPPPSQTNNNTLVNSFPDNKKQNISPPSPPHNRTRNHRSSFDSLSPVTTDTSNSLPFVEIPKLLITSEEGGISSDNPKSIITCVACGDTFETDESAIKHITSIHLTNPAINYKLKCPLCANHMANLSLMNSHIKAFHRRKGGFSELYNIIEQTNSGKLYTRLVPTRSASATRRERKQQFTNLTRVENNKLMPLTQSALQLQDQIGLTLSEESSQSSSQNADNTNHIRTYTCPHCRKVFKIKRLLTQHKTICAKNNCYKLDFIRNNNSTNNADSLVLSPTTPSSVLNKLSGIDTIRKLQADPVFAQKKFNEIFDPLSVALESTSIPSTTGRNNKNLHSNNNIYNLFDINQLLCRLCGKRLRNNYTLFKHVSRHFGLFRFRCDICLFGTYDKADLYGHMYNHDGYNKNPDKALSDLRNIPISQQNCSNSLIDFDEVQRELNSKTSDKMTFEKKNKKISPKKTAKIQPPRNKAPIVQSNQQVNLTNPKAKPVVYNHNKSYLKNKIRNRKKLKSFTAFKLPPNANITTSNANINCQVPISLSLSKIPLIELTKASVDNSSSILNTKVKESPLLNTLSQNSSATLTVDMGDYSQKTSLVDSQNEIFLGITDSIISLSSLQKAQTQAIKQEAELVSSTVITSAKTSLVSTSPHPSSKIKVESETLSSPPEKRQGVLAARKKFERALAGLTSGKSGGNEITS